MVAVDMATFQHEVVERSHLAFRAAAMDLELEGGPETVDNMNIVMAALGMSYATVCHSLGMSEDSIVEGIRLASQAVVEAMQDEPAEPVERGSTGRVL